jgi:hypothetical protein
MRSPHRSAWPSQPQSVVTAQPRPPLPYMRWPFTRALPRGRGRFVGCLSLVSSLVACCASSPIDQSSARAMRSAVSHVGFAVPASIPSSVRWESLARSATCSGLSSSSSRRSPMALPRARCGVGLWRTPEDSAYSTLLTTKHVSGSLLPLCRSSRRTARRTTGCSRTAARRAPRALQPTSRSWESEARDSRAPSLRSRWCAARLLATGPPGTSRALHELP